MHDKYCYRVVWSEEDDEYVGLCAEFPSLSWLAKTQDGAFRGIRKVVAEVLEDLHIRKEKIPEPLSKKHFSGKFQVRVPQDVHRRLAVEAHEAHVSLNRLVSAKLAA